MQCMYTHALWGQKNKLSLSLYNVSPLFVLRIDSLNFWLHRNQSCIDEQVCVRVTINHTLPKRPTINGWHITNKTVLSLINKTCKHTNNPQYSWTYEIIRLNDWLFTQFLCMHVTFSEYTITLYIFHLFYLLKLKCILNLNLLVSHWCKITTQYIRVQFFFDENKI